MLFRSTTIGGIGFGAADDSASESFENVGAELAGDDSRDGAARLAGVDETAEDSVESLGADSAAAPATEAADQTYAATTAAATDGAQIFEFFVALDPIDSRDLEQIRAVVRDALSDPELMFGRENDFEDSAATLGRVCLFQSADGPDPGEYGQK